jgi:conjugative relaxase-like TrwC/TraI family protein
MLTISKPLSARQVHQYHAQELQNASDNYYTEGDRIRGTWHGQLATRWGLHREVEETAFHRVADGHDPRTGEALLRQHAARTYVNTHGEIATTLDHRAGWDLTFSAPKSVSLTALVGGDDRVREAHEASVTVALDELERFTQARLGGDRLPETTGRWAAARFEHDSARPVDGYAAPQLHTHVVVFNLTDTETGKVHALQPRELYRMQQYGKAIYQSELAWRVGALAYEVDRGASGQPEIRGYTEAYLEASSPRRRQIEAYLADHHRTGAAAAEIAAHQTREAKLDLTHEAMQQRHRDLAETYGNQPAHVVAAARARATRLEREPPAITAHAAVTFATERNLEREAVVDERHLLRDALRRSMGEATFREITDEFATRVEQHDLIEVASRPGSPARAFTTPAMLALERETIEMMRAGQHRHEALIREETRRAIDRDYGHLTEHQRAAVHHLCASRDQVVALEGVAGAGKTTVLAAVRTVAERDDYHVQGFAPTSRAARQLGESGIGTSTLQHHLIRPAEPPGDQKRLYVLDEASLTSTTQMHAFFRRLGPDDRVLLVGDVRQHQAVDAGRPYQQLQEAGVDVVRLDVIVRQQDPALKAVVTDLSRGEVSAAVQQLEAQGRVHEIPDRAARFEAIAREYLQDPRGTLVVSPDNASRAALNEVIHRTRQAAGQIEQEDHRVSVLVPRQDLTGADRQWAAQYEPGDVIRYSTGSRTLGLRAGEYVRVAQVHTSQNLLVVARETGEPLTYDPRHLRGVTVYREIERTFARGDRVQLTAPDRGRKLANRELGTITAIDARGTLAVRFDSGRVGLFRRDDTRHLDYGYAVTSHSSQGLTANRVLVHIDTANSGEALLNMRFAYVAVSRGRFDAQLYTNDISRLADALGRDVSRRAALDLGPSLRRPTTRIDRSSSPAETAPTHSRPGHEMTR